MRLNSFDAAKLAAGDDRLQQFDKLHASQPGYVGALSSTYKPAAA